MRGEEVLTPVCVTVTDQEVDEYCKDVAPDVNCYDRRCSPTPKARDYYRIWIRNDFRKC